MKHSAILAAAAGAVALSFATPVQAQCETSKWAQKKKADCGEKTIVETAVAAGSFKILAKALTVTKLVDALQKPGPFTVFAPTDAAFAKLPKGTLEMLLKPENHGTLKAILTYHVVSGRLPASKVLKTSATQTLNGQQVHFAVKKGAVTVSGAKVAKADIDCSNGVIHVIDRVILPNTKSILATAGQAGTFKTLAAAVRAAGLVEALSAKGPFTVFAPTDAAFKKLPAGVVADLLEPENIGKLQAILKLHVVSGRVYAKQALSLGSAKTLNGARLRISVKSGVAWVNGARILKTDIDASNGVIHMIDTVLLPTTRVSKRTQPAERRFF